MPFPPDWGAIPPVRGDPAHIAVPQFDERAGQHAAIVSAELFAQVARIRAVSVGRPAAKTREPTFSAGS